MNLHTEEINYKRNIGLLALIYIPLVILSKIVRWTIMKPQLVDMSIGWGMVDRINNSNFKAFAFNQNNTEAFYDIINFCGLTTYIEWEWFFSITLNVIVFVIAVNFFRNNRGATLSDNIFIYLNIAILNIFCFNLAKEPQQMLCFLFMLFAIIYPPNIYAKRVAIAFVLFITAFYMRKYYGLVLIYYFVVEFAVNNWVMKVDTSTSKGKRNIVLIIFGLLLLFSCCQYVLLSVMSSVDPETYLEMIRVNNREGSNAASEITPIFGSDNRLLFTVDYFIKIFRLMFPIELLLKGKVTYLFVIVYHFMLFKYLYNSFINFKQITDVHKCALYLYIAFWMCSASFEPDFGSWIRHEGVAFPVVILMLSMPKQNTVQ